MIGKFLNLTPESRAMVEAASSPPGSALASTMRVRGDTTCLRLDATHFADSQKAGEWRIYSITSNRTYLLTSPGGCTCPDSKIRKRTCKHQDLLRAALVSLANQAREGGDNMETKLESAQSPGNTGPDASLAVATGQGLGQVLFPVADLGTLRDAVKRFGEITRSLLDPQDVVEIQGTGEITRSGWDKVALAYSVSNDIVSVEPVTIAGKVAFRAKAKVLTQNGRYSTGHGLCTVEEVRERTKKEGGKRDPRELHFAMAIAESRALKRAMAGLAGAGDLTQAELQAIKNRK